jgi:hypothetical protein
LAVFLIVLSVVLVVAIALIVVGREARRLDTVAPRTAYLLDSAVQYVADSVAPASQARLSHADVRALVLLHLERFEGRGLAPEDVTDRRQDLELPLFVDETDEIGYLLGAASASGLDVEDEDVAAVLAAHLRYLDSVGAVGPRAEF